MNTTDQIARAALTIAILGFIFACIFALLLNAKFDDGPEIDTALMCENVNGVVVCIER